MIQTKTQSLHNVGAFISRDEYLFLHENYVERFPGELQHLHIPREVIQKVVSENPDLCGIRFTYGFTDAADRNTKMVLLVPCYAKNGNPLPTPYINADGYLSHTGARVSLLETWEYLNNYVVRTRQLEPNLLLRQVSRTCFYGINQLNTLIARDEVGYIKYYFGYDPEPSVKDILNRYRIVLKATDAFKNDLDDEEYFDHGEMVQCPPGMFCCLLTTTAMEMNPGGSEEELNIFRHYRDNILLRAEDNGQAVEMYYHVSPLILDKINQQPNKKELYAELYNNYMLRSKEFIKTGDALQARQLFEGIMQQLMNRYLLN
ncbi:MAG: CFI-box-CTERM domain-containing protein [Bacteroidota bacterium]